jgi:subtilisin family serine protease
MYASLLFSSISLESNLDVTLSSIDSGIDYTHPLLGGKFGPGNKVIGGYDFVGDKYNGKYPLFVKSSSSNYHFNRLLGTNTPVPDNDPLDQCAGHGTHVAVSFSS